MNAVAVRVNCSVYRKGVKLEDIPFDEISEALEEDDTFVWLGLVEPDKELMLHVQVTTSFRRKNRIYYRDILDHVARVTETVDRISEMINAAMQVALAQVTIRQNDVVKGLAGWGAILAVPTMVLNLYVVNFKFMPELEWRWSYPMMMVVIFAVSLMLHRRLKRFGWL